MGQPSLFCQEVPGVKSGAGPVDGYMMLNAAMLNAVRIVDRGRFALALLIPALICISNDTQHQQ